MVDNTQRTRYHVYELLERTMKRTNIVLDEALLDRAKHLTGINVTRQLVDHALKELVRHKHQRQILQLYGRVDWKGSLSEMRKGRRLA